jgi:hypothetical protein
MLESLCIGDVLAGIPPTGKEVRLRVRAIEMFEQPCYVLQLYTLGGSYSDGFYYEWKDSTHDFKWSMDYINSHGWTLFQKNLNIQLNLFSDSR